jgi:translation initiation factor 1 (eIF-1/SUI1)
VLPDQELAKKSRRSRKRETQIENLQQATKDVEDAAKELEEKGPETQVDGK